MTTFAQTVGTSSPTSGSKRIRSRIRNGWGTLRRSPRMFTGVIIIALFVLVAIYGALFVHDANSFGAPILRGPSLHYPLGTTQLGQNVLSQLIGSTGPTLEVGFGAGLIATFLAVAIGIGGAFIGGKSDELLNVFTNIILVIPVMPLVIVVASVLKAGGIGPMILVIAFTSWAGTARILRSLTLSMRSRDYILASKVSGEKTWRVVIVELLPNTVAFVVSGFIFTVIFAILTQAGLAFLGVGNTSALTWGNMLYWAQNDGVLQVGGWWWFVPPGLCIAMLGTGLALINFGLDEMLNPRLRSLRPVRTVSHEFDGESAGN